jgi:hypothetical protein
MSEFKIISSLDKWDGVSDVMLITANGVVIASAEQCRQIIAQYLHFMDTHALVFQRLPDDDAIVYEARWGAKEGTE